MPRVEQGRRSKLKTLEEAADLIVDGSSVALGGIHAHNGPMAMVREIARRGVKDLTIIPNVSVGLPAELLIAAGAVGTIYASYVGLEHHGLAPEFRRQAEAGTLKVRDVDEAFLVYGMRAGAASLPFMPYPFGHEAVDVVRLNPEDYRKVTDPFTGQETYVVPPLNPDIGLIHVPQADQFGNVRIDGAVVNDVLIAKSSTHVIVTAEEIVPVEHMESDPVRTTLPGFFVDTVVHVPFGAHPTSTHGRYLADEDHIEVYKAMGAKKYLDHYVGECPTHQDYLERVGGELLNLLEGTINHVE